MYCSQCGTLLAEQFREGRWRPTCPMCEQVVYRQLKVGAGVIVQQDGALLLVRRNAESEAFPETWNLPAGYCEVDEAPPTTAAREAVEETGLQVRVGRLVDAYFFDDDPRGNGILLVYDAQLTGHDGTDFESVPTSHGQDVAAFFSADHLPAPLCGGGHDRAIEAWRQRTLDRWQAGAAMRYCPQCTAPLRERMAFGQMRSTCSVCGFVHFREAKVGVSVLVEREGQVLLVQRAINPGLGLWCLPSGFLDWNEAPQAAAAREVLEETGLIVSDLELLEVRHYTDDFRGPGINLVYRSRVEASTLQPGDDAQLARWHSPDELPPRESIAFHGHWQLLEDWQKAVSDLAAPEGCARMAPLPRERRRSAAGSAFCVKEGPGSQQ